MKLLSSLILGLALCFTIGCAGDGKGCVDGCLCASGGHCCCAADGVCTEECACVNCACKTDVDAK